MDTTILTDPFIWVYNDVVPPEKCQEIIDKFENSKEHHEAGITESGVRLDMKNSTDMTSHHKGWEDIDSYFYELIGYLVKKYNEYLRNYKTYHRFTGAPSTYLSPDQACENLRDTGYQIQRTDPGKGYVWHHDYQTGRLLTFILYLNTVKEGWTQFWNGDQVEPKAGRCLIFPATWTYLHQGFPPKQTKYLMTGWLYEN